MIAVWWAATAYAANVSVQFCARYTVDYEDVSSVDGDLDDDQFPTNNTKIAQGALLKVEPPVGSGYPSYHRHLESNGCTNGSLTLNDATTYSIKLEASGSVDGNSWEVRNNDTDDQTWVHTNHSAWTPVAGTRYIVTGSHEAWNIAAVAGFALERYSGVTGENYIFYTEDCPTDPSNSCEKYPYLYIHSGGSNNKYVIAHELGHAIMEACNGGVGEALNTGGTDGNCTASRGNLGQKQYQSNAANEGVAWYYAALTFNDHNEANCEVGKSLDFNGNGTLSSVEKFPSCEGNPTVEPWAPLDYMGNECTGTSTDRAVRFDYMRAFWDLTQDAPGTGQGLYFGSVCSLWLWASPDNWDPDGGGGANNPENRLFDAAFHLGILTEWDNVYDDNGIHR